MSITSTLIIQLIVFLLLVWFTMSKIWPPIAAALDERAAKIREGLSAADKAKADLAAARSEAEQESIKAREALRDQVASLAVKGAEQILRREVDAKAHADLLGQLKADL